MDEKLLKPYDPKETEARIYKLWEESGYFNPYNLPERHKEPFTIIMPPPNANGSLHAGHAVFVTIEDLIIRYKRMRGFRALWVPGADHAGFETQVVYEKKLEKEGRSRFKMDPKELYSEIMDFTQSNKAFMENQLRELGASCDWSREKFTLDADIIETVYKTFKKLSDDGLLYRGKRTINWCTKHQTSLSELETTSEEKTDPLYYIKYGPFTVATVRPETIFGDTAIAVNPHDKRYKEFIGREIEIDSLLGRMKLPVIADEYVDKEFGTGVVKITPAHDPNDFAIGLKYNLKSVEVIDKYGKLNEKTGKYAGLKVDEARKIVVEDLEKAGLLEKIDANYKHSVKSCYKCNKTIEPKIMEQWFVKTAPLAEKAMEAVSSGKIKFVTEKFEKIFFHWMKNIQDWNISRQIVWGIPIPAKICKKCDDGFADIDDKIKKCPKCGGEVYDDPDTFDTWFSSGQWPFAV
ncbi:MAG: class I tRNA ligase family protein, partial [Patescibacteria group bacterium]